MANTPPSTPKRKRTPSPPSTPKKAKTPMTPKTKAVMNAMSRITTSVRSPERLKREVRRSLFSPQKSITQSARAAKNAMITAQTRKIWNDIKNIINKARANSKSAQNKNTNKK